MSNLKDNIFKKVSYTSRDYENILEDMINVVRDLSDDWDNLSEADPLFILMSLFAAHLDILNYNIDYRVRESYVATALERASLVREADSVGYKIPSYKSAVVKLAFNSINKVPEDFTPSEDLIEIKAMTQGLDDKGNSWVYTGNTLEEAVIESLFFVQGYKINLTFSASSIDDINSTHILSNQSVAIGSTNPDIRTSRLSIDNDEWEEVESIIGKSVIDKVYELNVDTQGTTYIKFPIDFNKNDYLSNNFVLTYIITNGSSTISPPLNINNLTVTLKTSSGDYPATISFKYDESSNFSFGANPATVEEIRKGYREYIGYKEGLSTLHEYKSFLLNQSYYPVRDALVIDKFDDTKLNIGDDSNYNLGEVGIYLLPINETDTIDRLKEVLNTKKAAGTKLIINNDNVNSLTPVNINIKMGEYIPDENTTEHNLLEAKVEELINSKGLGDTLSSSEIYDIVYTTPILRNYYSRKNLDINLVADSGPNTKLVTLDYYQYMVLQGIQKDNPGS